MIIGKKEQERLEREQCAQISLLCRQKLMGYAESFEELGKSFRQEIQITGEDRQNILEKCMLWQSRQIMGDHLQEVARIMERVAGEELGYCPLEEKKRKSLVQALKSEGIIARDLCYVEKDGSSSGTEAGISMTLSTEKRHYKAAQVADMLTVLLGKKLQVSSGSPYLVEQEPHCFLFTEEPKYIALTGDLKCEKDHCTDEDRQGGSLTDGTLDITKEQILYRNRSPLNESLAFKRCQRCCLCNRIYNSMGAFGNCKVSHFSGKRDHKETSSCKSRVHKVLSKSTEQLFYNNDRKSTAKDRHPDWDLGRHVQCKQKSCYNCTEISSCILFMHQSVIQPFKKHTGCNRRQHYKECMHSKVPDAEKCCRQKCDHYQLHNTAGSHFIPDMGIR